MQCVAFRLKIMVYEHKSTDPLAALLFVAVAIPHAWKRPIALDVVTPESLLPCRSAADVVDAIIPRLRLASSRRHHSHLRLPSFDRLYSTVATTSSAIIMTK